MPAVRYGVLHMARVVSVESNHTLSLTPLELDSLCPSTSSLALLYWSHLIDGFLGIRDHSDVSLFVDERGLAFEPSLKLILEILRFLLEGDGGKLLQVKLLFEFGVVFTYLRHC